MKEALEVRRFHYYLSAPENELLRELIEKVSGLYPAIQGVYLYGSKARGDFTEESDLDLLFVTGHQFSRREKFDIYDMIFDLEVKYEVSVSAVFAQLSDFIERKSPFLREIDKEKVLLWLRG
ncbi:MAG: nucleotidyltransferase domain-containing protein [Thermodesulfovibrionales bacterium]